MRDLDTAGQAVVDNPPLPPTPLARIESSARRGRRLRVGIAAAMSTVVVFAASAVGIGISFQTSPKRVTVGPQDQAAVTDPQMRAHLGLDVPTSWVPVDYGDARLFVPADWKVTAGECPGSAPAWVEVGGPYKQTCEGMPSTFIEISGFTEAHEATPARVVHGYSLYAVAGNPDTFVVPALHVTIHAGGPLRAEALATLAPSSRLIALTYHGPGPSGWNEVGYSGITASYPPGWPEHAVASCGGVPPANVTLMDVAAPSCGAGDQTETGPTRDGLRIGRAQPWFPNTEPKQTAISNGNARMLLQPGDGDQALVVVVQLNQTNGVPVEIGLGIDGRVAAAILASIRIDGTVSTTTTTIQTSDSTSTPTTLLSRALLGIEIEDSSGSVRIIGTERGYPAARDGLAPGDIIDSINSEMVTSVADVTAVLEQLRPGDVAEVTWHTPSGAHHSAAVSLAAAPGRP